VAYNFVASTSSDITWTESASNYGASARSSLVCGWWYPTALTATRTLWGFGAVSRCEIATTTSEINLWLDRTTDSQHTTSGLGLAVNRWHFIAVLGSFFNTGVVTNYRVWRGVDAEIPSLVTVNVTTAGAGNSTGSTVATIGNAGALGTVAWEGDIGRFDFVTAVTSSALCRNATGLISADDEFAIFTQLVIPIWQGRMPTFYGSGSETNNGVTHTVVDLDNGAYGRTIRNAGSIATMDRGLTVSGPTVSANRGPIGQMRPVSWPDLLRR